MNPESRQAAIEKYVGIDEELANWINSSQSDLAKTIKSLLSIQRTCTEPPGLALLQEVVREAKELAKEGTDR